MGQIRKLKQKIALCLLLVLALATAPFYSAVAEAQPRILRVGYLGYEGFMAPDDSGEIIGYGVEYLNEIAQYANVAYEYVPCTWQESLVKLKTHEIDLVCTAKYTPERAQQYTFSVQNFGHVEGVLYTRPDNTDLYYEDFAHLDGTRIGFLEGSLNKEIFAKYAARNRFSYTEVSYESDAAMVTALFAGDVDAIATEQFARHDELRPVAGFDRSLIYLMSYKNCDFMQDLDDAMNKIDDQRGEYAQELYEKYYGATQLATSLNLTRAEADYIAQAGVVRVGQLRNRYPLSNYEEKKGELSGINEDILALLAQKTGLQFTCEPLELGETTTDALASGRFDLVMGVMDNDAFHADSTLVLTEPYLKSTLSVVAKKGIQFNPYAHYTVAMKSAFSVLQSYISKNYPQFSMRFYDTDEACLEAVAQGKADIMMQNVYVTNYLLQRPRYEELEILPTTFLVEKSSMMALAQVAPELISILNKAIATISSTERNSVILANTTAKPYRFTAVDLWDKYAVPVSISAVLLLLCMTLLVVLVVTRQHNLELLRAKNLALADAVNQAQAASRAKSSFLSRMSHEIRTPMNAILGLTELAQRHENDPCRVNDCLGKIDASSKVLLGIVNDVLDMSAIESDKLHIAHAPFDLKTVLNGISDVYYTQCRQKGIRFAMQVDVAQENLMGDGLRVSQILLNLISNACKFTARGGTVCVRVHEQAQRENKVYLRFTVSDTGCGISEEMQARLFKPFEQETAATAQKYGGSGLGLTIAKNLVEMMQGAIAVRSQKGVGTEFVVELPFDIVPQEMHTSPENLNRIRVIIVEDVAEEREYMTTIFKRIGVQYDMAESGEQALQKMHVALEDGCAYNVCLVDWCISGMGGFALTRRLREKFCKDSMIVAVSAYDLAEIQEEAKRAGADLFVQKPVFQSTVFNLLLQLAGKQALCGASESESYDFAGHKVLLVEDNDLNAEIAMDLLELVHMEVLRVKNGQEAVQTFQAAAPGTFDGILMDVQMPEMDGYEATRAIRTSAHSDAKSVPIYAMTANAFTEDVSAAISAGMNGHIAKPIDTRVLYSTLAKIVCDTK